MKNNLRTNTRYPYHYGKEAGSYTFYRIPKLLFTEPEFQGLSIESRLLYGLLLDRMQLSIRNHWMDEEGKVFIYFTIKEIMGLFSCGNGKAGNLLAELDDRRGIGLITRVRQGLGRPDKIYVRKCASPEAPQDSGRKKSSDFRPEYGQDNPPEPAEIPDFSGASLHKCEKVISDFAADQSADVPKAHTSETEKNHTEKNKNKKNKIHPSINPYKVCQEKAVHGLPQPENGTAPDGWRGWREDEEARQEQMSWDEYQAYFEKSLSLDLLRRNNPSDRELINEIAELVTDVCSSREAGVRIGGEEKPLSLVRRQLMRLNSEHIEYVMECLKKNRKRIYNIRQYLIAILYNAVMTIHSYYTALVGYDLHRLSRYGWKGQVSGYAGGS